MEELVTEINVNMSVELQSITLSEFPTRLSVVKPLEIESVPHVDLTLQLMKLPLLENRYKSTSLEHTRPGPTSCVDRPGGRFS